MDHEQQARQRRIGSYPAMPPAGKCRRIMELRAFAGEVKRAGSKSLHSGWSDGQEQARVKEMFLYVAT